MNSSHSHPSPLRSPLRSLLALALLGVLPGCLVARVSVNQPIDPEIVAKLEPGMTSADVVRALGAPTEVVQLGLRSAYRFDYVKKKRSGLYIVIVGFFNEDTREDRVWAFFDEEGVLTHLGATFNAADAEYTMPWTKLHE